jgi:beta-glucosidase
MAPSDFKNADVKAIVEQLTTDELIQLSAGVGFWRTAAIDRLGIPSVKVRSILFSCSLIGY